MCEVAFLAHENHMGIQREKYRASVRQKKYRRDGV
jgi:hypothetical protein